MTLLLNVGMLRINPVACLNRLCKISKNYNVVQVALMTRLSKQKTKPYKPPPYPYWERPWQGYERFIDPMIYRFDENTRLLVVEGLPAMGKSEVCEKIAAEFGLLYMPSPTHEELYVDPYGYDIRTIDDQLPFIVKCFDLEKYLANPNDIRTARFQELYFLMRLDQYINALLHIVSTGQGVVLNRCAYSDKVFTDAMFKHGHISPKVYEHYKVMWECGLSEMLRPHAIIYLDAPVEIVKEKIKQRGRPEEVNSKVLSTEYLTDLETGYKNRYLKALSSHTHILAYDWSKETDFKGMMKDISRLPLDDYETDMLKDWSFDSREHLADFRNFIEEERSQTYSKMMNACNDIIPPELFIGEHDQVTFEDLLEKFPGRKYQPGFNPSVGNKVLFKSEHRVLSFIRYSPRDFVNSDFVKLQK